MFYPFRTFPELVEGSQGRVRAKTIGQANWILSNALLVQDIEILLIALAENEQKYGKLVANGVVYLDVPDVVHLRLLHDEGAGVQRLVLAEALPRGGKHHQGDPGGAGHQHLLRPPQLPRHEALRLPKGVQGERVHSGLHDVHDLRQLVGEVERLGTLHPLKALLPPAHLAHLPLAQQTLHPGSPPPCQEAASLPSLPSPQPPLPWSPALPSPWRAWRLPSPPRRLLPPRPRAWWQQRPAGGAGR